MTTIQPAQSFLRKRKMFMMLPVLALPFITLGFWALGGGKARALTPKQETSEQGMNLSVPGATLKNDRGLDKMSYYDIAQADSEKIRARVRNDTYFKLHTGLAADTLKQDEYHSHEIDADKENFPARANSRLNETPYNNKTGVSPGEAKAYEKLKEINAAVHNANAASKLSTSQNTDYVTSNEKVYRGYSNAQDPTTNNPNLDPLRKMMKNMKGDNGGDSEMIQINSMLEKVMDIQHPERLNEKYKEKAAGQKGLVYGVSVMAENNNGFYSDSSEDRGPQTGKVPGAIEASVFETQTLVNGSTVQLRLLTDITVNGILIPKDNSLYGTTLLAGERLMITINSIHYQNFLLPVALSVYDMDGMSGIHIPGAITRDVAKQTADNALQAVALNSLDPSIGTQAATAGLETAKTLLSKKIKLVRATVPASYKVLLKDNNNK